VSLATWSFHDLDHVIVLGLDGAEPSALDSRFLLDLESRRIAFLLVSVTQQDSDVNAVYLEGPNDLEKFLRRELFLGPLFKWEWGRLARDDVEGSKCS
jgi:hypothetical protein